jgi:hypothetical protein
MHDSPRQTPQSGSYFPGKMQNYAATLPHFSHQCRMAVRKRVVERILLIAEKLKIEAANFFSPRLLLWVRHDFE